MKKAVLFCLVLLLFISALAGCAKDKPTDQGSAGGKQPSATGKTDTKKTDPKDLVGPLMGDGSAYQLFLAFREAKYDLVKPIQHGVYQIDEVYHRNVLGSLEVSDGDHATHAAELLLGDIGYLGWLEKRDYEDNEEYVTLEVEGNKATVSYRKMSLQNFDVLTAELIDGSDWIAMTLYNRDGSVNMYAEILKTSYGYAAQYYFGEGREGEDNHCLISVYGKDGVVGLAKLSDIPPRLSGNESQDFPKTAPEWHSIQGNLLTCKLADGNEYTHEEP